MTDPAKATTVTLPILLLSLFAAGTPTVAQFGGGPAPARAPVPNEREVRDGINSAYMRANCGMFTMAFCSGTTIVPSQCRVLPPSNGEPRSVCDFVRERDRCTAIFRYGRRMASPVGWEVVAPSGSAPADRPDWAKYHAITCAISPWTLRTTDINVIDTAVRQAAVATGRTGTGGDRGWLRDYRIVAVNGATRDIAAQFQYNRGGTGGPITARLRGDRVECIRWWNSDRCEPIVSPARSPSPPAGRPVW